MDGVEDAGHADQYLGDAANASSGARCPMGECNGATMRTSSNWRGPDRAPLFMPRLSAVAAAPAESQAAAPGRAKGEPQPAERFVLTVGPSPIDGLGVFAGEAIPARRKIGEMRGEIVPVREARRRIEGRRRIHVVEVTVKTAIDATKSDCALRHVNHSCAPNAVLRIRQGRAEFYAIRDIAPGEEICADYGESHHEGRLRCRCGAPNCKGRL